MAAYRGRSTWSLGSTSANMATLSTFLPVLLAVAFVVANQRAARAPARVDGRFRVVEYPAPLRLLGPIGGLLLLYVMIRDYTAAEPTERIYSLFYLAPLVLLAPLGLHLARTRIRFDEDTCEVTTMLRATRSVARSALGPARAAFSGWVIEANGFGRIRFNPGQRGYQDLLAALRPDTSPR